MAQSPTLVVVFCMHRSGSSTTTDVLHRLGMSLGPFELLGPTDENRFGYFEARPIVDLNAVLQTATQGFLGDMPLPAETVPEFCARDGAWLPHDLDLEALYQQAADVVQQLIDSGSVVGFKDPRMPLVWPFWKQVFARFPHLRIVLLAVLRSPHEIAMSLYKRSGGLYRFQDVLDVCAVHFRRMLAILADWPHETCQVRFDTRVFEDDLRAAAGVIGLPWRRESLVEAFDARSKHYEPLRVAHVAQNLFESLGGIRGELSAVDNLLQVELAADQRETMLRTQLLEADRLQGHYRRLLAISERELAERHRMMTESFHEHLALLGEMKRIEWKLELIQASRLWRWRERLRAGLRRLGLSGSEATPPDDTGGSPGDSQPQSAPALGEEEKVSGTFFWGRPGHSIRTSQKGS